MGVRTKLAAGDGFGRSSECQNREDVSHPKTPKGQPTPKAPKKVQDHGSSVASKFFDGGDKLASGCQSRPSRTPTKVTRRLSAIMAAAPIDLFLVGLLDNQGVKILLYYANDLSMG